VNQQEKGERMAEASAEAAELLAKSRGEAAKNAARNIPLEVAESLAGIRRELRGIKIVLCVLGIIAFISLVALTS